MMPLQHHDTNIFEEHPVIGMLSTIIGILISSIPYIIEIQLPIIIVQSFQIATYSITIIVGLLTIGGWIKKHIKIK